MQHPFIYLIDDDEDDCEIFKMALEIAFPEAHCKTESDAAVALQHLNNNVPDYLFIDLNMPLVTGRECIQHINNYPKLSGITTVVYSTSSHETDIEQLQILGANHYLVKPHSINALIFVLKQIIPGTDLPFLINSVA